MMQVQQGCWLSHDANLCNRVADSHDASATELLMEPWCKCNRIADWAMRSKDLCLLCLMGLSTILYSLAAVSHAWFILPPHSFYGLWSVVFCDFLQCQVISALFSDEPGMCVSFCQRCFIFHLWALAALNFWTELSVCLGLMKMIHEELWLCDCGVVLKDYTGDRLIAFTVLVCVSAFAPVFSECTT